MRQYKLLIKRIEEEAIINNMIERVSSRDGIINMHSLAWNQFGSEAYTDMFRWSWRKADQRFTNDELHRAPPPPMVLENQFTFNHNSVCEWEGCNRTAFIKCSHCGKHLCVGHFLDRVCFHHVNEQRASTSSDTGEFGSPTNLVAGGSSFAREVPTYNSSEEEFIERIMQLRDPGERRLDNDSSISESDAGTRHDELRK